MKLLPFFINDLKSHLIEVIGSINQEINEEKRLCDNSDFSIAYYNALKEIVPKIDDSVKLMSKLQIYPAINVTITLLRAQELNNMVFDLTETTKTLLSSTSFSIAQRTLYLMEIDSISSNILNFLNIHVPAT